MKQIQCTEQTHLPGAARGIQLFIDDSARSEEAVALMQTSGRIYQTFQKGQHFLGCDFTLPALFSLSGMFQGLDEIRTYARSKLDLDAEPHNRQEDEHLETV